MMDGLSTFDGSQSVALRNARVPQCLLDGTITFADADGLCLVDILVSEGSISAIGVPGGPVALGTHEVNLGAAIVMPCFVDMHTHIDKGHIWLRKPNPDGTFMGALEAVAADREANWSADDVRRRMDFSLRCAYAHGTKALRTHLDSIPPQHSISWPVFREMRNEWRGRIDLQAVSLFGIEAAEDVAFLNDIANLVAKSEGVLGTVAYMAPDVETLLDRVFAAAMDRGLDLDFHADETDDPSADGLRLIAEKALEHRFPGRITVGHCCSLSRKPDDEALRILDRVAQAGLAIVSLPMCNMYLQDRRTGTTPRWRGVTLLHEFKARGIDVAVASDNTRDPFYAYGDLDMLEVFREATRILHLDHPVADWPNAIARTPADVMGLPDTGRIAVGLPADFVLFRARSFTELLARPQSDRLILRSGEPIEKHLPSYAELDDLMEITQ